MEDRTVIEPCPFCGFQPHESDDDFCYLTTRDGQVWGAHCYESGGGCGASVLGDSREDAIRKWNTRPQARSGVLRGTVISNLKQHIALLRDMLLRQRACAWAPIDTAPTDGRVHVRGAWVSNCQDGPWFEAYSGSVDEHGLFVLTCGDTSDLDPDDFDVWIDVPEPEADREMVATHEQTCVVRADNISGRSRMDAVPRAAG